MWQLVRRYSLAGLLNTAFGYSIIFGLMLCSVSPLMANFLGYGIGLFFAFFIHRNWVFQSDGHLSKQATRFLFAYGICFGINHISLGVLLAAKLNPYWAQIIAGIIYSILMFFVSKIWIFHTKKIR